MSFLFNFVILSIYLLGAMVKKGSAHPFLGISSGKAVKHLENFPTAVWLSRGKPVPVRASLVLFLLCRLRLGIRQFFSLDFHVMGANARRQPDCFNFSLLLFSLLRFPPFLLVLEFCVVDYFTDRRLGVGSDFNQIKPVSFASSMAFNGIMPSC